MELIDSKGSVNGNFQEKTDSTPGTIVSARWLNDIQGEIANVILQAGIPLDIQKKDQLSTAISKKIVALSSSFTQSALQSFPCVIQVSDGELFVGAKQRDTFSLSGYVTKFGNGMAHREFYLQPTNPTSPFGLEFPDITFANTTNISKRVIRILTHKSAANMIFTLGFVIAGKDSGTGRGYITPTLSVRADTEGNLAFTFGEAASLGLFISQDSAIYTITLTSVRASGFVQE